MKEEWKDIKNYEGLYKISSFGCVLSLTTNKILSSAASKKGYETVNLSKNGKEKTHSVHKLVASHFIDNPESKKYVNHIDYNKLNNRVDNLEWVSAKENSQWSLENNRKGQLKSSKAENHYINKRNNSYRFQFNRNNKIVILKTFHTLEEAIKFRNEWFELNMPNVLELLEQM